MKDTVGTVAATVVYRPSPQRSPHNNYMTIVRFTEENTFVCLFSVDYNQTFKKDHDNFLPSTFSFGNCLLKVTASRVFNLQIINKILCFRISKASTNPREMSLHCVLGSMVFNCGTHMVS